MKTYVVGGAVRDEMLGLPVKDHDHVVVGATPEEMIRLGFKPVGKDFPVFLHPQTHEEYALARTERKTAPGYHGFTFHAAPDVTLEQDLQRRDLTINAMARDAEGHLIDPHCGANDLGAGVLRHVSEAFAEDPVRILRVARFAARFGFSIAPETMALMKRMVRAGEADALIAERVWQELARGFMEKTPSVMLGVLHDCGALKGVMPQVEMLYKSGRQEDAFAALNAAAGHSGPLEMRFSALLKMLEPEAIETLCAKLRVPAACRDLAVLTSRHGNALADGTKMEAGEMLAVFDAVDAWRRPERFAALLQAALAGISEGEKTRQHLLRAHEAALAVDAGEIARSQKSPADIKAAIAQARLDRLRAAT